MERIINRIHIAESDEKKPVVSIEFTEIDERGSKDSSIKWRHKPKPEFTDAMQALKEHAIDIAEFPDEWLDQIQVRGVSFSYEKERSTMGVVISFTKKLEHSNTPLNISTAHKIEYEGDAELQGDSKQYLTPQCVKARDRVKDKAEEYLDGAHAADNQEDMFGPKQAPTNETPEHILSGRNVKRSVSKETMETFKMGDAIADDSKPSNVIHVEVTERREKELQAKSARDLDVKKVKKNPHKK